MSDSTKRVSVDVPAEWADEAVDSGWSPSSLGLSTKHAPGLLVAEDVSSWPDLTADISGVFIGTGGVRQAEGAKASALTDKVAGIKHGGCSYGGSRAYSSSAWRGSRRT
ncbi:serine/threonine protein kinase, partial [Streptomyces daliensis]|nr:serine/threonine protein kinase [Streptomyces daliensis]